MPKKFELIIIILFLLALVLLWVYYMCILVFHYDMDIKTLIYNFFKTMNLKKNEYLKKRNKYKYIRLFILLLFITILYLFF